MAPLTPVRAASLFVARLAALTPREWAAIANAHATRARLAASESGDLRSALRGLDLPGRRAAHLMLHEWLDALTTPLFAASVADPADADPTDGDPVLIDAYVGDALQLAEHAVLALLVSDALAPAAVARLYAPFANLVPLASLGIVAGTGSGTATGGDGASPPD